MQVGREALVQALERFDPDLRTRLGTFAYPRIRGALSDALLDAGRPLKLPRALARQVAAAIGTQDRLVQGLGRWPTWQDVATEMQISHVEMAELRPYMKWPVSYEERASESEEFAVELEQDDSARTLAGHLGRSRGEEGDSPRPFETSDRWTRDYSEEEVKSLLAAYARSSAQLESGSDSTSARRAPRRPSLGLVVRLFDLNKALARLPTAMFVVVELHGLKGLPFREVADVTGIPHTTGHARFNRGITWIVDYLNQGGANAPLRRAFWSEDLQTSRFAGMPFQLELFARRGQAKFVFDGKRILDVRGREAGDGWLIPPVVTGFVSATRPV